MAKYTIGITYSRSDYFDVEAVSSDAAIAHVREALINGTRDEPTRAGSSEIEYDAASIRDITEITHD